MSATLPGTLAALPGNSYDTRQSYVDEAINRLVYLQGTETVAAPAALSLTVGTSLLAVDATDAHTLAAPTFAGQFKHIATISAANTPVSTVTVTGMRISTVNVFAGFGTISDSAPKSLTLFSPDGVAWDIWSMVGVTVS